MKRITGLHVVDNISTWVGRIMAVLIFLIAGVTLYGVIMRYLVRDPIVWGSQVLLLLFIPVALLAGGYVLLVKGHVRLDVLYSRWSPRGQAISDAATFIVFLLFTTMLAWAAIEMAWESVKIREVSWYIFKGPIYPKKIALALAVVLLLLQGMAQFVRNIRLIKGKGVEEANSER